MLPERLKELRTFVKLTQEELANNLKIPRGTYAHYELGKRSPDPEMLEKIADYFNVSVDYLLGRTDSRLSRVFESWKEKMSEDELELWNHMSGLTDEEKVMALPVIKSLLDALKRNQQSK